MQARGVGLAHVGRKRENNEDCWLVDDQLGLYVVADGMGGHRGGEVAAKIALEVAVRTIRSQSEVLEKVAEGASSVELERLVRQAIREASRAVLRHAKAHPEREEMGCTLTLLLVARNRGVMGHVGDSRLYLWREGIVHQISRDHTLAAELAREGVIEAQNVKSHKYGNALSQFMGRPALRPDILRFEVLPGDRALLCSDGFSNYVTDDDWLAAQLGEEDLDGIPEELVEFANDAGGGDNITALVVGIEPEPDEATREVADALRAKLTAVESFFLCQGLSFPRQSLVISHCELREHAEGEQVVGEGAPLAGSVLLVDGSLVVRRGEARVGRLRPGEQFGATALLGERPARAAVVARERSRTLTLEAEGLRALTRIRPRLGAILCRRLAAELAAELDPRVAADPKPPAKLLP